MLRLINHGSSIPVSIPVDPSAEFESGMIGQLKAIGNQIVCGVSDGTAPFGVIDDMKKTSFTSNSIDEVVIAPIQDILVTETGGRRYLSIDVKMELENSNVIQGSFISKYVGVQLIPVNGLIVFLEGTELNFDMDGDGVPDAIRTVVSYSYRVPDVPGDDTTSGSGQMSVWIQRIWFATDQFETNQTYALNSPLFVSEAGKLTSSRILDYPAIGIVTAPPGNIHGFLECLSL
jgi:hypothetical protein